MNDTNHTNHGFQNATYHIRVSGTTTYRYGNQIITDNVEFKLHRKITTNCVDVENTRQKRSMGS